MKRRFFFRWTNYSAFFSWQCLVLWFCLAWSPSKSTSTTKCLFLRYVTIWAWWRNPTLCRDFPFLVWRSSLLVSIIIKHDFLKRSFIFKLSLFSFSFLILFDTSLIIFINSKVTQSVCYLFKLELAELILINFSLEITEILEIDIGLIEAKYFWDKPNSTRVKPWEKLVLF